MLPWLWKTEVSWAISVSL